MKEWFRLAVCVVVLAAGFTLPVFGSALSLDQGFNPPRFSASDYVGRALLLPTGKYLLFRATDSLKDQPASALTRYLADGSLDSSFQFSSDYESVSAVAPLGNKLIVAASQRVYGHPRQYKILLVNDDGSIDQSLDSNAIADGSVSALVVQPDGKILVGGFFTAFAGSARQGIVRLLANGSVDPDFAAVTLQFAPGGPSSRGVYAICFVPADGKVLVAGNFFGVNSVSYPGIVRLGSNGTLDATFQPSGFSRTSSSTNAIRAIGLQTDQKIVIAGRFTVSASFAANPTGAQYTKVPLIRLNPDGSADQNYGCFTLNSFSSIKSMGMSSDQKAIGIDGSVYRFNTNGTIDSTFHQPVLIDRSPNQFPTGFSLDVSSTGSLLISGTFSNVQNAGDPGPIGQHFSVARLNGDGTVDQTLQTSHETSIKASPRSFLSLNDGSTLIAFDQFGFTTFDGAIPHNFGRLTTNGALDVNYDPIATFAADGNLGPQFLVTASTFLPNGNLFVGGRRGDLFFGYGVIRADGTEVPPVFEDDNVNFSYAHPYGSAVLAGDPYGVQVSDFQFPAGGNELRRFGPDGTVDYSFELDPQIGWDAIGPTFDPATGLPNSATAGSNVLAVLDDGKILFSYLASDNTYRIVRLHTDGSIDDSFSSGSVNVPTYQDGSGWSTPTGFVPAVVSSYKPFADAQEMPNGQIIIVGEFNSYAGNAAAGIVRINSNGTVDPTFQAGAAAQWTQTTETDYAHPAIDNIELSTDAKLLVTGSFEAFNGTPLPGIASLNLDGSLDPTFVAPATRRKFDPRPAYLHRQPNGSYLLSGPYSLPAQTLSPSFIRIKNATKFLINATSRSAGVTTISFDAVNGNRYRLEYKDSLTDEEWQPLPSTADIIAASTGTKQFVDTTAALSRRSYRVRLAP
ncbi:MAG TPA: delta-60 repeat domain-containing protein [Chthoniobacterales bacterium]|nr:delta-60 repeat domain-containing protein [Chthoniobacterales bacterium]